MASNTFHFAWIAASLHPRLFIRNLTRILAVYQKIGVLLFRDDCWWIDVQCAMDGKWAPGQWKDVGDLSEGPGVFRRCRIDCHNSTPAVQAYAI